MKLNGTANLGPELRAIVINARTLRDSVINLRLMVDALIDQDAPTNPELAAELGVEVADLAVLNADMTAIRAAFEDVTTAWGRTATHISNRNIV